MFDFSDAQMIKKRFYYMRVIKLKKLWKVI